MKINVKLQFPPFCCKEMIQSDEIESLSGLDGIYPYWMKDFNLDGPVKRCPYCGFDWEFFRELKERLRKIRKEIDGVCN